MSKNNSVQMQSFKTADNRPILLENYSKANEDANRRLKVDEILKKNDTDILSDIAAGKRKRTQTSNPKKKARKESAMTKQEEGSSDSDSIDWSDDEGFTKNISVIEASFREQETTTSFTKQSDGADDDDINWSDDEFILKI